MRIYFKIRRSTKRFVFFEFLNFLRVMYMYVPARCFRLRTYVA